MIEIIPAILPKSFADLEIKLGLVREAARIVQVDVVDGVYAPSKTWPYSDNEAFEEIVSQDRGLPFWEDFDFQFDCMISHPQKEIDDYIAAGASGVVVHGAGENIEGVLTSLQKNRGGDLGVSVGVALLPSDDAGVFAQYEHLADFVQVMGIAKVGFQGSAFDARAINLITSLRGSYPELTIQVDGGVNIENARVLAHAGANRLVVGSAIFGSDDPMGAIEKLSKEANR